MKVSVGKHAGKSVESLVLKESGYIYWLMKQSPSGQLLSVKEYADLLISKFDAKPSQENCCGRDCNMLATRASVYRNDTSLSWWCDNCDPYKWGANPGRLQIIRKYKEALVYVELYCESRKSGFRDIIKQLAQSKGLPSRVGEAQCVAFFQ